MFYYSLIACQAISIGCLSHSRAAIELCQYQCPNPILVWRSYSFLHRQWVYDRLHIVRIFTAFVYLLCWTCSLFFCWGPPFITWSQTSVSTTGKRTDLVQRQKTNSQWRRMKWNAYIIGKLEISTNKFCFNDSTCFAFCFQSPVVLPCQRAYGTKLIWI